VRCFEHESKFPFPGASCGRHHIGLTGREDIMEALRKRSPGASSRRSSMISNVAIASLLVVAFNALWSSGAQCRGPLAQILGAHATAAFVPGTAVFDEGDLGGCAYILVVAMSRPSSTTALGSIRARRGTTAKVARLPRGMALASFADI
jgi:hypothetical protein